ncbi:hypothetical protein K470DRAFT_16164 [Piedraia hortae CBS 480.64]|uniref:Uncharacterized protein n=1 Tax=Piedraia hortae CBS 480.64 TaxID=1314780 RepID=A0A6A7C4A1_9PEZI|nr:hypothetical protein K470DRAFT_16164 [Piedraia hortae CBS 480.64]
MFCHARLNCRRTGPTFRQTSDTKRASGGWMIILFYQFFFGASLLCPIPIFHCKRLEVDESREKDG